MTGKRSGPLLAVAAAVLLTCSARADPTPRIVESANAISMELDGRTLWTLHHDPVEGKPYFHPLATTDGTPFTSLRPEDHPWHRGVWFSWKYINGINYWEEDRTTGLSIGRTRLLSTKRTVTDSQTVQVRQELDYAPGGDAAAVLKETRAIDISAPDANGVYQIDWSAEFRALDDAVELKRTPIPGEEEGKDFGGYAGLSIRMNQKMKGGNFLNSEGLLDTDGHGKASEWMLFHGKSGGSILFMDHPENLRHPPRWYVGPNMPYFSPAVLFGAAYTIPAGESLSLRYRMIISPGKLTPEEAKAGWSDWVTAKTSVLILTGANNHDWKATTDALENVLGSSGRYEVHVELHPESLTREKLARHDVLLSNWNAFGKNKPAPWPESFKQAYVDFVRNGGGHVVVHAGSSSHYDWEDYQSICLATWKVGMTGHQKRHDFKVRPTDRPHAVTSGLESFQTFDELWFRPSVHPDASVLAESFSETTGNWEPAAVAGTFGKGRCFTILLGHDAEGIRAEGFRKLLLRGIAWVDGSP